MNKLSSGKKWLGKCPTCPIGCAGPASCLPAQSKFLKANGDWNLVPPPNGCVYRQFVGLGRGPYVTTKAEPNYIGAISQLDVPKLDICGHWAVCERSYDVMISLISSGECWLWQFKSKHFICYY